ncbi:neutral zinc metallopeptidase [Nonomuraea sp. ATR24]|uniref:neutral zinc metallopeptidase n=1 Tax=Nonomuraea sp. ATR24 TaxID=1676744 RepID=UPI0035C26AD8
MPQGPPAGHGYPPPPPQGAPWQQPPPPPRPPGHGPYGNWQPPRRKSGIGVAGVVGGVFGAVAGLFLLIVIGAALFGGSGSRSESTTPVAIPTASPYEPREGRTREPSREPTEQPTQEPTEQPTEQPTRRPTETPTRDDEPDTTVEPPRQVTLNRSLKNNTMYRAGALPRMACRAGNASIFSHSQLKSLILRTSKCMDRAWGQILSKQGIPFRPPNYAIASGRGRGACGDYPQPGSMVPYYCPRNSTIYASTSAMAKGNGNARGYGQIISWHGGIISMMAHEYGHHVQNITGLMDSWWAQTLDSSSNSGKLALSRRLELQATCFGGMWMRSVAASYPINTARRGELFWFYGQVGDYPGYPRDHGSRANNQRWFRQGWEKSQAYQCNTWVMPSSATS